ncbi:MAG: HNH endonuclease [Verrucomicrobia bacterium]|nr:HNH endonuclease [Verrucomicrobiota bacterium]
MANAPRVNWTREQLLIALNLYCKLPFGQFDKKNPIIVDVAKRIGRTPDALVMKLCNFASFDPVHHERGVGGFPNVSKLDRALWEEFHSELATLGPESEEMLHDLFTKDEAKELDFLHRDRIRLEPTPPTGPTESNATVRVRRGQQFFRQAILNAYGVRCCISGINVPRLLVASHIKPWRDFPDQRLNPRNGLCLSSIHDAAFDAGLITLDEKLKVVLSKRLKAYLPQPALEKNFVSFEGKPIQLPSKLAKPDPQFLAYHRSEVFSD